MPNNTQKDPMNIHVGIHVGIVPGQINDSAKPNEANPGQVQ